MTEAMRTFVAASLEDEAELAREAEDARHALERAPTRYPLSTAPLCTVRSARLYCFERRVQFSDAGGAPTGVRCSAW